MNVHATPKTPEPVDLHVGARMRARRRELGLSQENLADALGVSFQQVQKYENGTNRVAPARLVAAAKALNIPLEYFFPEQDVTRPLPELFDVAALARALRATLKAMDGQLAELERRCV